MAMVEYLKKMIADLSVQLAAVAAERDQLRAECASLKEKQVSPKKPQQK